MIVIGAGFSGLYALHRLRELGLRAIVIERAEKVGGTWFFNRYPGARCDIESIEYSYSFSDEIQQEWVWTETMPAQPEIEAYLNFVADRLDLRRDILFNTDVVSMTSTKASRPGRRKRKRGSSSRRRSWSPPSGILSVPLEPDIPGMDTFTGTSLFTSRWPRRTSTSPESGRRHRHRLDRCAAHPCGGQGGRAAHCVPTFARVHAALEGPAFEPGELDEMKAGYGEIRAAQREHPIGAARLSASR